MVFFFLPRRATSTLLNLGRRDQEKPNSPRACVCMYKQKDQLLGICIRCCCQPCQTQCCLGRGEGESCPCFSPTSLDSYSKEHMPQFAGFEKGLCDVDTLRYRQLHRKVPRVYCSLEGRHSCKGKMCHPFGREICRTSVIDAMIMATTR